MGLIDFPGKSFQRVEFFNEGFGHLEGRAMAYPERRDELVVDAGQGFEVLGGDT